MTKPKNEILAWHKHPEPDGTNYTENDLSGESQVSYLFDFCQKLEAIILPKGWEFLFNEYGLVGLLKINSKSGWMKEGDLGDSISEIIYQSLITGFHPLINEFGDYDENESFFYLNDDSKLKVDWKEIYALKDELD